MKTPRPTQAFTLIELLVVIAIIALLASLAIPAVQNAMVKGQMTQTLNNEKQIFLAAYQMATDATTTNDQNLGWPGNLADPNRTAGKITNASDYVTRLMGYDYLKPGDVTKVFAAPGFVPWSGTVNSSSSPATLSPAWNDATNNPFKIYMVTESDGSDVLFLATKNYTYNTPLSPTAQPYGDKGFVIIHKGGDAAMLKKPQANNNVIAGVGPLPGHSGDTSPATEGTSTVLPPQ